MYVHVIDQNIISVVLRKEEFEKNACKTRIAGIQM